MKITKSKLQQIIKEVMEEADVKWVNCYFC